MDVDRNALLVVGWGMGEYPAGEGEGCGSGRPAVEDLQGRDKGGDKGIGLKVWKTQKISLAVVCWGRYLLPFHIFVENFFQFPKYLSFFVCLFVCLKKTNFQL